MASHAGVAVKVIRLLVQPPEVVFDAWLDEQRLRVWMLPGDEVLSVRTDRRVGGTFSIKVEREGFGVLDHHGDFLQLDRPREIAFTFLINAMEAPASVVRVHFAAEHTGTRLTLTHEGVAATVAQKVQESWAQIVDRVTATL